MPKLKPPRLFLSCEHAVNYIPVPYQVHFDSCPDLLSSHRGFDEGALLIAEALKRAFSCELIQASVSRLLIDCNRSLHHRYCFSEISRSFSQNEKTALIESYYLPYRQLIQEKISGYIKTGERVLHLSIHSFTPVFNGLERAVDLGLLYDPQRKAETSFVRDWQHLLKEGCAWRIRRNYPYRGNSDGLTTTLRTLFPEPSYLGIEVEFNQLLFSSNERCQLLQEKLQKTLALFL